MLLLRCLVDRPHVVGTRQKGKPMFVKITAGRADDGATIPQLLWEATDSIESGYLTFPADDKDPDLYSMLPTIPGLMTVAEIDRETAYTVDPSDKNKVILVRWAAWGSGDGRRSVVTTRKIFILSDSGKTIDRV